ncbi:MAG: PaaI family thioesterase [Thermoflavifilum sp.]|nr:PaaI family thioesterase [Thermoflavifilum sp.]MCL6514324.1 PaaI family thioesterase [Alicyclobacillus sp.]
MNDAYLEQLRQDFEASPFWQWFGIRVTRLEAGRAEVELPPSPHFLNVNDAVHGGVIASLVDSVMGIAIRSLSTVPAVTQTLTTQFLRAPDPSGTMRASAEVVRHGRQVVSVQAQVTDAEGRLIALGMASFIRVYREGAATAGNV